MTGSASPSRRRGQPVIMLAAIAAGWIALRTAMWEQPFAADDARARPVPPSPELPAPRAAQSGDQIPSFPRVEISEPAFAATGVSHGDVSPPRHWRPERRAPFGLNSVLPAGPERESLPGGLTDAGRIGTDRLRPVEAPKGPPGVTPLSRRWHVDTWYAWRSGSEQPRVAAGGPRAPAYGGTQGGIVVRYDLGQGDRRPQLYLRGTHAPARPAQADVAAGIGLRPLAAIPVRLQAEARLTRTEGWTDVRPAVAAITELAPAGLPLGFRVEAYAQTGLVGGREATGFVDGQVRVDRELVSPGEAGLRLGVGAWGGAQKYAARLDVGPGVTLDLRDAGIPARISLDYRVRLAGKARPSNGPALTLATGF
jgi:hypothetical protein